MTPLKILRLTTGMEERGGIKTYARNMATALAGAGHEVHVLSCGRNVESRDERSDGVHIHVRPIRRYARRLARRTGFTRTVSYIELSSACWREARDLGVDFDVVDAPHYRAEGLFTTLFGPWPTVARIHTAVLAELPYHALLRRRDARLAGRLEGVALSRATAATCSTTKLLVDMRALGMHVRDDVHIVRHPVGLDGVLSPVEVTGRSILVVGRIQRRKAPEVLIQACARLAREFPDVEIVWVGRDGDRDAEQVRASAANLGTHWRFVGEVTDAELEALYRAARVVAVPSHQEGLSNAGLQAMAAARPVVCSDACGIAELLQESGGGTVVPVRDPASLANGLSTYLRSPEAAAEAGNAGRRFAERECSLENFARRMEVVYRQAIRG